MEEKTEELKKTDLLFILVSCMELALGILEINNIVLPYTRYILWFFFGIYFILFCLDFLHNRISEKILSIIAILIGVISYICSGSNMFLKMTVYFFAMKRINKHLLIKGMLITMAIMVGVISFLSLFFGFQPLYIMDVRGKERGWNGIRWTFGFNNPNTFEFVVFHFMLLLLFMKRKMWSYKGYLVLLFVQILVFLGTDSRTGFLLTVMFIVMSMLIIRFPDIKWKNILLISYAFFMIFFLAISLSAAVPIHNSFMSNLDTMLSGRMEQLQIHPLSESFASPYMENWHLFSSRINKGGYDLGYIQMFYYYGIIPALVYLIFVSYSMRCAWKRRDCIGMLSILSMCCYLLMESRFFSNYVTRDFLFILAGILIWNDRLGGDEGGTDQALSIKNI